MESESTLLFMVLTIAKAGILVAIPVILTNALWSGLTTLIPADFFQVPMVYTFARIVGIGFGFAMVYAHKGGAYYDLHVIFLPESPWNTSLVTFLTERVNPLSFDPAELFAALGFGNDDFAMTLVVIFLLTLFAITVVSCLKIWRGKDAMFSVLAVFAVTVWLAYLTIYALSLLFWLMFTLNYWAFLLLALIVQYYRRRSYEST